MGSEIGCEERGMRDIHAPITRAAMRREKKEDKNEDTEIQMMKKRNLLLHLIPSVTF